MTKPGGFLLQGGAEFKGMMAASDRAALDLAGGPDAGVVILPTAAAAEGDPVRAGRNGERWFASLGATHARALALYEADDARNLEIVSAIRAAKLVYISGGDPDHLFRVLAGSPALSAIEAAHADGATIAGSSAGAMVLCGIYFSPAGKRLEKGLGMVPGFCVIPHHEQFGKSWAGRIREASPDTLLVGIDEETGMIRENEDGMWRVLGKGAVIVYDETPPRVARTGGRIHIALKESL